MAEAVSDEELDRRRLEMRMLSPEERNMLIALGTLSRKVIDGRQRFKVAGITVKTSYEDMA